MIFRKQSKLRFRLSLKDSIEKLFGIRREEIPSYSIILKKGAYEIREYDGYICAEVRVKGTNNSSIREAFMKLAGYIFGANQKIMAIPMTAPVFKQYDSEIVGMTAPVLRQSSSGDELHMSFIMPKRYSLEDLPVPDDSDITFKQVHKYRAAVLTYSGYSNVKKEKKRASELLKWLSTQTNYSAVSGPIFAGYDPPWTLGFLRKNEVIIKLNS